MQERPKRNTCPMLSRCTLASLSEIVAKYGPQMAALVGMVAVAAGMFIGVRATEAVAPLSRVKPLLFGQTLNFSGRSQQPKMKKNYYNY